MLVNKLPNKLATIKLMIIIIVRDWWCEFCTALGTVPNELELLKINKLIIN